MSSWRLTLLSFCCIPPDLDECTTNSFDCQPNAACQNIEGSYTCGCKSGYTGNGKICNGDKLMMIIQKNCKIKFSFASTWKWNVDNVFIEKIRATKDEDEAEIKDNRVMMAIKRMII